jgi:hypothetical protein
VAETDAPRFVIVEGSSRRTVRETSLTLGRKSSAGVVVRLAGVSRLHATISYRAGRFVLRDAGSTNGTWVDGRRVVEHALSPGETIVLGGLAAGGDLAPDGPGRGIVVGIDGSACTLEVASGDKRPAAADVETTAELVRPLAARLDLPEAFDPQSLVVSAPVRGKARIKSGRWVPTSDLATNPLRRWSIVGLVLLSLAAGLGLLWAEHAQSLTPGGLTPAHMSQEFRLQNDGRSECLACHEPWRGVSDAACKRCHEAEVQEEHAELDLACGGCHREHRVRRTGEGMVPRHRCLDCHPAAHSRPPELDPQRKQTVFLKRPFSAPLVHADHRSLKCARCHAGQQDQKTGRVTTGCAACHGGASGMQDARCLSCHRYHQPAQTAAPGF